MKNDALLNKMQIPAALGFRTVADAASVQNFNSENADQLQVWTAILAMTFK